MWKFQEFVHTKHENLKIANIPTNFSVQKTWKRIKSHKILVNQNSLIFRKSSLIVQVSLLDQLKFALILLLRTWKMLSASRFGVFLMDQVLILWDPIWTIKLDCRKDQRILIKKYLMAFKPFSTHSTEILDSRSSNLKISRICTYKTWKTENCQYCNQFFSTKTWKWLKSHKILVNQNSLIFPTI